MKKLIKDYARLTKHNLIEANQNKNSYTCTQFLEVFSSLIKTKIIEQDIN